MVKFLDIQKVTASYQPELSRAVARVIDSGLYVRAGEVKHFEEAYASFIGTRFCVGVGNGFDALRLIFHAWLILKELREGDEVIVPANTYIASILAISESRLTPVLVEPDPVTFNIDPENVAAKITSRTRAIMVVHLYGRNAMTEELLTLAGEHHLKIVEDNAQAAGCFFGANRTGALGAAAAHSFFPTKNLGALGDGGAVTTDDAILAETIRTLGNYGSGKRGYNALAGVNSRLDELQAAVLRLKLSRLDDDNAKRRRAAQFYLEHIAHSGVMLPVPPPVSAAGEHVWHLFVIRCTHRNALKKHLADRGIETLVHYPVPPHQQAAYRHLHKLDFPISEQIHREALSLPLSPVQEDEERICVVRAVNGFVL